jgi:hypothetical protein
MSGILRQGLINLDSFDLVPSERELGELEAAFCVPVVAGSPVQRSEVHALPAGLRPDEASLVSQCPLPGNTL